MPFLFPSWLTWGFKPPLSDFYPSRPHAVIPDCSETRGRLRLGSVFIRSKDCGPAVNRIWCASDGTTLTVGLGDNLTPVETWVCHPTPGGPGGIALSDYAMINDGSLRIGLPPLDLDVQDNRSSQGGIGGSGGFPRSFLSGGGGLPATAVGLYGNMFHRLVYLRYSERFTADGSSESVSTMLCWTGDTEDDPNGKWSPLGPDIGGPDVRQDGLYNNISWSAVTGRYLA